MMRERVVYINGPRKCSDRGFLLYGAVHDRQAHVGITFSLINLRT
jgi:hypothetical protein